jgi:hypothetical protein
VETRRRAEEANGWTVRAPTVRPERCAAAAIRSVDQAPHTAGEPGCRGINPPAAIRPVWLATPARIAAWAMRTVMGWLVSAVIQRQVRLYVPRHAPQVPGHTGETATPTAAVVWALCAPVAVGH